MNAATSNTLKLAVLATLPVALLLATSCSSTPEGDSRKQVFTMHGVPGQYSIETFKTSATVTGIDVANRKVTVVSKEGKKQVLAVGPEAVNFDQIRVGDQVVVTMAEELVVYMAHEGVASPDGSVGLVARAPKGDKPGVVVAGTAQVTAKVIGLDSKSRKAVLKMPDGTTKTIKVRPDVDLSKRSVGEEVVFRSTDAVAIRIENP